MEAHCRGKYLPYGVLIVGSWLFSCLLHFQFFDLSLFRHPYSASSLHHRGAGPALAALHASSFLPPPPAIADDSTNIQRSSPPSSPPASPCEGRYVYMLDIPSRFDVLRGCAEGSPAFEDEYRLCDLMSNAGLGPELAPASGNGSDGESGVVPNNGWFNTNQYSLEVIFHNRMKQYECLTDDPAAAAAAAAVYVPYYPGLEVHRHFCGFNGTMRDGPSAEFLRWLSSRPQWAAHGGRDHFMVAARTTWMFRRVEGSGVDDEKVCGNSFLDQPESENMTVLTYESNIWARRDVAVPYPTYYHPSSAGNVAAWQAHARGAHRPWLFSFAGGRRPNGTLAIRDRILDRCVSSPRRCGMLDCSHGLESQSTCQSPRRLISLFVSSRFCLQPRGDSYMRRSSVDAVIAGCIPVFFSDASFFKKQYLWHEPDNGNGNDNGNGGSKDDRRYSVFIDEDEVLEGKVDIEEVLSRYTDEEVAAMREEVIKMIPRFLYKDPRVRFEGDMRDAFDIAIDEVTARTRRIKDGEDLKWGDSAGVVAGNS